MRGVQDEVSRLPPLFPRVHVNDTEIGAQSRPRARPSPRNQIALYEQLTLPPSRHISDLPSTHAVGGWKRNRLTPFCNAAAQSNLVDKLNPAFHGVTMYNATAGSLGGKMKKGLNHPNMKGSFSPFTNPNSFKQNDLYEFENFSFKNPSSSDNLKVPNVRDLICGKESLGSADLSLQLHTNSRKAMEEATVLDEKSPKNPRNPFDDDGIAQAQDCKPLRRPQTAQNQETGAKTEDASLESFGDVAKQSSFKAKTQSSRKSLVGLNYPEDVSECSIMDSPSGLSASPDNIFKLMGDKHFWNIRTTLINQQRIFAAQVFELHKLIKVQKMLARLPNLLLEPAKAKKSSSPVLETAPKAKSSISKVKPAYGFSDEPTIPKLPLPSISKKLVTHQPSPAVTSKKPSSPLWFPPPASQWLVPVVSPTEGMIYKPYAGPCHPTSGFMAPSYESGMFDTAFRFTPHHNQFGIPSCFRSTVHSTSMPGPVVEQVNTFAQAQSSCSHISQAMVYCLRKPEASKDCEFHGSTASSSPLKQPKREILPLFPTEPTHSNTETDDEHREHPPLRAIKAIPHHPLSASETAARIFQSIQEERRHYGCRIS